MRLNHSRAFCLIAVVGLVLVLPGCNQLLPMPPSIALEPSNYVFEADGIFVRHLRVRLAPSHTKTFEAMMRRCVVAATNANASGRDESFAWLCYREPPGRYWIVQFADTQDVFQTSGGLQSFLREIALAESVEVEDEFWRMLMTLEYRTEWEIVTRQKTDWSTVGSMTTDTHPKARMMQRTIRRGMEAAFESALTARTAFLARHDYPLPIEGFVTLKCRAVPSLWQIQVVFPVDWSSFHETDSFYAFVKSLDQESQDEYADLKASLMETMSGAEYYDGDFVAELSHSDI